MNGSSGFNNKRLKSVNRGLVFRLLATGEANTRITIARMGALSKMTLTNIINEFEEKGYVVPDSENSRAALGVPISLSIAPTAPKLLGINIMRETCCASVCDFSMRILESLDVDLPAVIDAERLMELLFALSDALLEKHPDVMGIGIGCIGPLDLRRGILLEPLNFSNIQNLDIRMRFEQRYQLPVSFDHHYNCAALAEHYFGNGKNYNNLLYIGMPNVKPPQMSGGIGLGVICGGSLYSDFTGYSCEIGHVAVNSFSGPMCDCGNRGCLGAYASIPKIIEDSTALNGNIPISFREICRMSEDHPQIDTMLMDQIIQPLIYALTSVVNLLYPEMILIGDAAAELPDRYFGYIKQCLNNRTITRNNRHILIKRAYFPSEYDAAACATGIMRRVFNGEYLF